MAGNDDAAIIVADGARDGPHRFRLTDAAGDVRIRTRFARRYGQERVPDASLEFGPAPGKRQRERASRAGKIFADLCGSLIEHGMIARHDGEPRPLPKPEDLPL